jgi:hypothetical protein
MPKPRTKDEIAEGMKRIQEAKRMRAFVRDKFYPALVNATTSIDDAKYLLGSFSNMVMERFLEQMKEMKFIDLKLHEKLDKKNANYDKFVELLALFGSENVLTARELIEGMKNEVQMNIDNELKGRKLETLKTNFLED